MQTALNRNKVLIIDDDEDIREAFGDILEAQGFQAVLASDGAEGMRVLQSQGSRPGVILLDMMMPGTSGWEFLDQQRQDPQLSQIPVIVCSAYVESGKSVRPDAFLPKPVGTRSLVSAVRAFCH